MEIRVLEYFLTVAREGTITGAAEVLHITQPTLSRQLGDLEKELGKTLMIRGKRRITLTEDGMILRRRAEEILEMVRKTEAEVSQSDTDVSGDIYIGTAETEAIRNIAHIAMKLREEHPMIRFNFISGDAEDVLEKLDRGLYDFCVICGNADEKKYQYHAIPHIDTMGVLMKKDSPLAALKTIPVRKLYNLPLVVSRQQVESGYLSNVMNRSLDDLNIAATYNLLYNASLMVSEGMGYALCLGRIIEDGIDHDLTFRPLAGSVGSTTNIIWKKYQVFSRPAELFMEQFKLL